MAAPAAVVDPQDRNKIKVSSGRSVFFYVDLATRFLKDQEDVELSGLGYGTLCFHSHIHSRRACTHSRTPAPPKHIARPPPPLFLK